jgi:hypothetical protein
LNAVIEPLRTAVANAVGIDHFAEAGNDYALPDLPDFLYGAFRVESMPVATMNHDWAVRDRVSELSVTFVVALRRDPSGATEAMARLRSLLSQAADAALDTKTWGAGVPYGLVAQGGEWGMAAVDEYGQYFQTSQPDWVAGHITVTLQVVSA